MASEESRQYLLSKWPIPKPYNGPLREDQRVVIGISLIEAERLYCDDMGVSQCIPVYGRPVESDDHVEDVSILRGQEDK